MKKMILLNLLILVMLIGVGCSAPPQVDLTQQLDSQKQEIGNLKTENQQLGTEVAALKAAASDAQTPSSAASPPTLLMTSLAVAQLLADGDMAGLAPYVHPTLGVRFTPYSMIDTTNDLVFTTAQIPNILTDPTVYTWGSFDGSGDPIALTPAAYFTQFVTDQDFVNPHMIGNNTAIGTGNSINNLVTAYPTASFVEFHFTGFDPQYGGIDWASLRLVFENVGGNWLLIGIVHDGWTI